MISRVSKPSIHEKRDRKRRIEMVFLHLHPFLSHTEQRNLVLVNKNITLLNQFQQIKRWPATRLPRDLTNAKKIRVNGPLSTLARPSDLVVGVPIAGIEEIEGLDWELAPRGQKWVGAMVGAMQATDWDGVVPSSVTRLFIGHRCFHQTIDIPESVIHLTLSNGVTPVKWPRQITDALSQRPRHDLYDARSPGWPATSFFCTLRFQSSIPPSNEPARNLLWRQIRLSDPIATRSTEGNVRSLFQPAPRRPRHGHSFAARKALQPTHHNSR